MLADARLIGMTTQEAGNLTEGANRFSELFITACVSLAMRGLATPTPVKTSYFARLGKRERERGTPDFNIAHLSSSPYRSPNFPEVQLIRRHEIKSLTYSKHAVTPEASALMWESLSRLIDGPVASISLSHSS